jgi:hypothetical protein
MFCRKNFNRDFLNHTLGNNKGQANSLPNNAGFINLLLLLGIGINIFFLDV